MSCPICWDDIKNDKSTTICDLKRQLEKKITYELPISGMNLMKLKKKESYPLDYFLAAHGHQLLIMEKLEILI